MAGAFVALLVAVFSGLTAAGGVLKAGVTPPKFCGTINAGGHVYTVSVLNGVKCASGLKWAKTLAAKRVPAQSIGVHLSGGPRGFSCVGSSGRLASSFPGVPATAQVSGFCRQGTSSTDPYFNWFLKA